MRMIPAIYKLQAGTEHGHAQLKLGLEFTPIFCKFSFSGFSFYLIGLFQPGSTLDTT